MRCGGRSGGSGKGTGSAVVGVGGVMVGGGSVGVGGGSGKETVTTRTSDEDEEGDYATPAMVKEYA